MMIQRDTSPSPHAFVTLTGSADERAAQLARRCGGGHETRHGWQAHCPSHDDSRPSLSITPTGDKVLLHCHSGCSVKAICAAGGIAMKDLFAEDIRARAHRAKGSGTTPKGFYPP